jgi:YggT family protein
MFAYTTVQIINIISNALVLVVIVDILLGYFLSPVHPLRSALDKIVQPMLNPIRKIVPLVGGLDFSPLILVMLIQVVTYLVRILIYSL